MVKTNHCQKHRKSYKYIRLHLCINYQEILHLSHFKNISNKICEQLLQCKPCILQHQFHINCFSITLKLNPKFIPLSHKIISLCMNSQILIRLIQKLPLNPIQQVKITSTSFIEACSFQFLLASLVYTKQGTSTSSK